ncbi:hypothetical protein D3C75_1215420 [compost metagenome]
MIEKHHGQLLGVLGITIQHGNVTLGHNVTFNRNLRTLCGERPRLAHDFSSEPIEIGIGSRCRFETRPIIAPVFAAANNGASGKR